jgi:hypothetical protein
MTTNQPLSLFISSKMTELATERQAVQAALSQFEMYGWLWEKDAGARPEPIRSTYLKEVEACDLYIGLFWLGYGPYTIEEYEHARNHKKPCLIYKKHIETDKRDPKLTTFLDTIDEVNNSAGLTVCRFETPKQLALQVKKDVIRLLTTAFRDTRKQPSASPSLPGKMKVTTKNRSIAVGINDGNINQYNYDNAQSNDGQEE